MKYSEAAARRVFVVRLEDGEVIHEEIERFAFEKGIRAATVIAVGAADGGSKLVVGPEDGAAAVVQPMELVLDGVHEIAGVGTLFPGEDGQPSLHMHVSCGRGSDAVTGCIRRGVKTWKVLELVVQELVGCTATRKRDKTTGFELLKP